MKTITEQVADLEATRAAKAERMAAVMQKSLDEGRSTDAGEAEEFDTLEGELATIDSDLVRLRRLETVNATKAKPVEGNDSNRSTESRQFFSVKAGPDLPKGTRFTRYAMALAAGHGSISDAIEYAKRWDSSTPDVGEFIKATAGTTTGANWAAPLMDETNLVGEFIELLRPATILGKIPGLRRVPFNVKIAVQTGGSTVGWVGEAAAKPVGELAFDTVTLGHNKVAGIVVLTDELVRFSSPSAEETVRTDLVSQTAQFLDQQFLDPALAGTPGVSPASITNGITPVPSSGGTADDFDCDLQALIESFISGGIGTQGAVLIMSEVQASRAGMFRSALDSVRYPGMNATGGTLNGYTVITSENLASDTAGGIIVMLKPSEILLADDGNVTLDASREATLDMAGGNAPNFSLWQKNCVGIRAERWITWKRRRDAGVAYISGANYTVCV